MLCAASKVSFQLITAPNEVTDLTAVQIFSLTTEVVEKKPLNSEQIDKFPIK